MNLYLLNFNALAICLCAFSSIECCYRTAVFGNARMTAFSFLLPEAPEGPKIWEGGAKLQQTKMLVTYQRWWFVFIWAGLTVFFSLEKNIIKVGSKSWLLTCSTNITLSLPSYTGSALKRKLNFCNGYLSLLYFWVLC